MRGGLSGHSSGGVANAACDAELLRATRLAHEAQLDVAPLGKIPHLRTPGLLVMDMDSTAIQIECIDEIAKLAGTGEKVAEVTERAMRG
ncbi:Phosphoserine phosphatase, partial [Salmonella enterica subsp. enterica serovar Urbana str. R8-2977]